jgi:hypothetical protein
MKLLDWAGALFRWLAGAVVPMFARPVAPVGLAWFLHFVLVVGTTVGLFFLEREAGLRDYIGRGPPAFQKFWLPALFVLVYTLAWAVRWWILLLAPGQPTSVFPDLDTAWDEILEELAKAGIGIADTPLFLVFGECPMGFEALFRALPHGLVVAGGSAAGSPIRAFANRDGIYLTVPGASLLGIQGWIGTGGEEGGEVSDSAFRSVGVGASIGVGQSVGINVDGSVVGSVAGSMAAGQPLNEIQQIIRRARDENRPLNDDEKRRVRELSAGGPAAHAAPAPATPGGAGGSVLQHPRLLEEATARLTHVLGRIAATRWPLCPINGAILSVPADVSDRDDAAQQWGLVAREDLARTEAALRLRFPVFALVGGVEVLAGGATFFERFAVEKGSQRLGKGFPLNPDVRPADVGNEIEKGTRWIFGSLLPYWVFKLMRADGAAGSDSRDNAGLFRFMVELRRRAPRLGRLLSRALGSRDDELPVYGGCYLSVTLYGDPNDAKFAKEFFRKVESAQGAVAWTPAAYDEDAGYRSATRTGYAVLALIALGVLALAGYVGYLHFLKPR